MASLSQPVRTRPDLTALSRSAARSGLRPPPNFPAAPGQDVAILHEYSAATCGHSVCVGAYRGAKSTNPQFLRLLPATSRRSVLRADQSGSNFQNIVSPARRFNFHSLSSEVLNSGKDIRGRLVDSCGHLECSARNGDILSFVWQKGRF